MEILLKKIFIIFIILMTFVSCKQNKVDKIIIGDTLYVHQDFKKNQELRQLIRKTLNKDEKALVKLIDFWCGGGAGCYDLGFIITQIIYKLGEKDFMAMVAKLNKKDY